MTTTDQSELAALLSRFIDNSDRSVVFAGRLESEIDRTFPEDDEWQELVLMLASYRPGGGDFLYDEDPVVRLCTRLLARLKTTP